MPDGDRPRGRRPAGCAVACGDVLRPRPAATACGRPLTDPCPCDGTWAEPYTLGPVVDGVRRLNDRVTGLPLSGPAGALRPVFPERAGQLPPAPELLPDAAGTRGPATPAATAARLLRPAPAVRRPAGP
ncbi:hypothetical protein [Streptomyces sp. NPDC006012]|uniref:hypothetical protein n=1 Tax=Streptomyces sp. NPDC006012 TaxID=3364739 RepID=UPI00367F1150